MEAKLDAVLAEVQHMKGQFDVISPRDMAKLVAKVEGIDARTGTISALAAALVAGVMNFFFRGGNSA